MSTPAELDQISLDRLREVGSVKWSLFPGTIGAFVAEMDFGTSPQILAALHKSIDDELFGYLPPALGVAMSEACAAWQKSRYGWEVPAERIRPLPDVLAGLTATIEHFTVPGSKVVLPTPAYMPFLTIPPQLGREIIQVPMLLEGDRYVFDLDGLDRAFSDGGGLLILCNPYNPLGRVFTREELEAVSRVVAKHGARVFSDEIHAPLVYKPAEHIPYASIDSVTASHTITATSASKAWNLPGLKTAQLILSNDADAELWAKVGMMPEHGASNPGVIANTVAYNDSGEWLDDTVEYLDGNRALLGELFQQLIPGMHYTMPEGTYIAWLDARDLGIDGSPAEFFREKARVALTDGASCGIAGEGFLRFIFATSRPIIEQAVRQMAHALDNR